MLNKGVDNINENVYNKEEETKRPVQGGNPYTGKVTEANKANVKTPAT